MQATEVQEMELDSVIIPADIENYSESELKKFITLNWGKKVASKETA